MSGRFDLHQAQYRPEVNAMRLVLLVCALVITIPEVTPAQEADTAQSTVSGVLQRMTSPKWAERSEALDEAINLTSGKQTSRDADRLRLGIIQLLIRENNGGLKEPDNITGESYSKGEDKSEYYAGLIDFVAGLNDERAIPALLGAANTGSMATRAVARFGKRALDPTLAQVRSQDPDLAEGAVFVIREMLTMRTVSDSDSQLRIKNALRSALASPEHGVREDAVSAIEYLEDREEFVPPLQNVAEHDPYKLVGQRSDDGQDNGQVYPVRRAARLLLRQIANHEPPVTDKGVTVR